MKKSNLFKQILAYTLVFSVIFSQIVFGFGTSAAENSYVWDGTKAESFAGGDGSAATPFLIETAEQLYKMVVEHHTYDTSYGKYFEITKDIYLNDVVDGDSIVDLWGKKNWLEGYGDTIAAASKANSFNGTLDGNGHTIYGLYADGSEINGSSLGLFPAISDSADIKNLNFNNVLITGGSGNAGAIAGSAYWKTDGKTAKITNCSVTNATIGQWENIKYVGGFVGATNDCTITFTNCYAYDLSLSNFEGSIPGGMFGTAWDSGKLNLINCYTVGYFPAPSLVSKAICTNVYTDSAIPEGNTTANVIVLTAEQMKGDAAKTNMTAFDFEWVWQTVENGYPVICENPIFVWDGTKSSTFAGGTGTASDPYLIENAEQLAYVVSTDLTDGLYFKLIKDIRINDTTKADWKSTAKNWVWADVRFVGTFDGDGHTIDGLYYKGRQRVMGLFSYVGADNNGTYTTTVKNFNMTNAYIESTAADGAGFAAGQASRVAYFDGIYIDDTCEINSTVKGAGGILGQSGYNVFMSNIAMNGKVVGGSNVGAFVGTLSSGARLDIKSSYTSADLYAQGVTDRNLADASANVYVVKKQGTVDAVATQLTLEQMKGEAAKENMIGLSFKYIWETVENGFPVYNLRGEIWDGSIVASYDDFEGSGTAEDPYLIENGAQLAFAVAGSSIDGGYHFKLVKDIILNDASYEGWQSSARSWVRNTAKRFNGELDGDGHIIEGLYFNATSGGRYGLIAYIGKLESGNDHVANVKNIKFVGASISNTAAASDASQGAAVVAGQASGETIFENIIVDETSSVSAPNVKGVAGIVGRGYNEGKKAHVTIRNSAVLATISGGSHVGAFGGTFWDTELVITIDNSFADTAYGLLGDNKGTVAITNTYTNVLGGKDTGAVQVDSANMKGEAAKTNMPSLDYICTWEIVDGKYPILRKNTLEAWDGSVATALEGEGTKENPYKVSNGAELYYMVSTYSNADVTVKPETQTYFEITADINLGNRQWFVPGITNWFDTVAYDNIGFNGIIYGNGHTVYNLINSKVSAAVGLIPVATQGAEIHDLHIKGGNLPRVDWRSYALGGLIGFAKGVAGSEPISITGCSVEGLNIKAVYGAGGLVGYSYSQSLIIKDCYVVDSTFAVDADKTAKAAAFIGFVEGSEFNNSYTIETSYCDTLDPQPHYKNDDFKAVTTFNNVYTTNTAYDNSVNGLKKLTTAEMTGVAARENLSGFNFNQIWQYGAEGEYPTHKTNEEKTMYWNGTVADNFAGGEGTIDKPYEISNAEQLFLLANAGTEETTGKYYKLTGDINISNVYEGWENDAPYSWTKKTAYLDGFGYGNSFAGTLDGAGYTVRGLYYTDEITNNGTYAYGLIPFVSANAVIKNLNVEDVAGNVTGDAYMGAVVGAAHVTETDAANALNMVQFVGVNVANSDFAILGGASRGVKLELCNAEKLIGSESEKISVRNCNSEDYKYNDDVLIYNALNADGIALTNVRKYFLGNLSNYITDINGDSEFDIRDLVSIKKSLAMVSSDEYELVWSQEFNDNAVDYSVLTTNKTMSVGTTLEYADNAVVNNGSLTLSCEDTARTDANGDKIYTVNYGLSTIDTMSFKYGRLEMRAKVPFAAGAFPSLWLTSRNAIGYETNSEYSTEIDVFEMFGKTKDNDTLVTCIHKWYNDEDGNKTGDECSCGTGILAGNGYKVEESDRDYQITGDAQNEYHTFVFEWDEDSMSFSVDGNVYYTATKDEMNNFDLTGYDTGAEGIFEQFLCIRLNNHMYTTGDGAAYTYNSNASEIDASKIKFEIDYIRLYQKDNGEINLK